ncbi:MAG: hypothetical protein H6Q57_1010 [Geobacteraceae bacterium]|nr:hypothetical protein [Geobacteraceae bacterium]
MDAITTSGNENLRIKRLVGVDKSSLPQDGGSQYNRLIFARSPYLLQHAENPVDWHQWGDGAFVRAKEEDKPVFLSIGYATCHWCHVMERESFEDEEVAELLNRHFISIKVDREERPDVDDQYMTVAQMMKGGGGWPLNVFLTPDRQPFYVMTYLPKKSSQGMTGFMEILEKVADVWKTQRDVVESSCATIIKNLVEVAGPKPAPIPGSEILESAYHYLEMLYDRTWGGFGSAPKFPRPLFISFLLRYGKKTKNEQALEKVEHSLKMIRNGGIYDQLGFGFHRYSVDQKWLVPHFEKMLYDQAMLAMNYTEAFQATGNALYGKVAEEIFTHVQSDMTSPDGGFYSARDADTEGVEGKYYLWTPKEVGNALGEEAARTACSLFDVTERGNFEGENILHLDVPIEEFALREGIPLSSLNTDIEKWRKQMLNVREERVTPLRDDKILTAWNGLMIAALAKGFAATGQERFLELAERAVVFIREKLVSKEGRLLRSHYLGESSIPGFLEDYAFFTWGLIEMYEATLNADYLLEAVHYSRESLRLFVDEESYGFFDTGFDAENVLVRKKSTLDGVIPSGNSVAAMNFLRIGKIIESTKFKEEGQGILRSMMGDALQQPAAYSGALMALEYLQGPDVDVTMVGNPEDPVMKEMLRSIGQRFIPHLALRVKNEGADTGYKTLDGKPTAYVCHYGTCRPPVTGAENLGRLLDEIA